MSKEIKKLRADLRRELAKYIYSEGCSCCQDTVKHEESAANLAKLLNVPKYEDGSGYDFTKYRNNPNN